MDYILFNQEEFESSIDQLNREYAALQDIYDELLYHVMTQSDKIDDFKYVLISIKEEIQNIQEKIYSLKVKAESIRDAYLNVEEINLRMVEDLSSAKDIMNGGNDNSGMKLYNQYRVVSDNSSYVVNSNYDFEDWLVDWLNTSGNRM